MGSHSLPPHLVDGCVVLLQDVKASLSPELIRMLGRTSCWLQQISRLDKKRRRVNQVCSQVTALDVTVAAHSSVVLSDEAVAPFSSSSSSVRVLARTPDWLLQGGNVNLPSIHPVRPGLGTQSMSDSDALGFVADQLLNKAWETTRLTPEAE